MPAQSQSLDASLDALVEASRLYGSDPDWVFAGGGNTSLKTDDVLYVKGSGQALATIDRDGFVALDRAALSELMASDLGSDADERELQFKLRTLAARVEPEKGQRPSIEALLHNFLPGRFVVHTHPAPVNAITCCTRGRQIADELFGDDVLWVDYVDPGYTLARALEKALDEYRGSRGGAGPKIILIQSHGLFLSADSIEAIHELSDRVMGAVRARLKELEAGDAFGAPEGVDPAWGRELINTIGPALRGLLGRDDHLKVVVLDDSPLVRALTDGADGESVATAGTISPDHLLYAASFPLWFEPRRDEAESETVARLRKLAARVVLVKGLGMFAAGDDFEAAEMVRIVYANQISIMAGARGLGGIQYLSDARREFIEDWAVEKYRQQVADSRRGGLRAPGKVAVVTGAAQGFGLEIAGGLAAEGAHVVLCDVNVEGAAGAAGDLCEQHGKGAAMALRMDVMDAASVAEAIHQTVRAYGGLDLLVSNAGVLRAQSVKTQPESDFDFVTRVNYKGYFLCVQNAARILATQHLARPGYWSDIIQINSKSGLVGSNRNAAYAGGKFGGIGLTQSFALELVEDGVKVNSICPGNFFDGPLWSDPENGLFVQYLRAKKVPGAKTVEDVRRAYEQKVPMARGCTTADVMNAIYYLMSQTYETGQALPVTGGQVMLK